MSDKNELKNEQLDEAAGGSILFNGSIEEARTKFINNVNDEVQCSSFDGQKNNAVITKLGIGHELYGGCSHRYDNYYYCEPKDKPNINGWYKSFNKGICSFGPRTDAEINLVEEE